MRLVDADALIALVEDSTILGDGFKQAFCAIVRGEPTIEPQPMDAQEAYYRGKIDGIKECTARLKRMTEGLN